MNLKGFFGEALSQALDLGIATPDDVIKHVTPDLLAEHLPRPLWARLLTACLGAPKVDAQLVVETIGIPNLCEHVPTEIMWACISEIALRSLGREFVPAPVSTSSMSSMSSMSSVSTRAAPLAMTPPPAEQPKPSSSAPSPRPRGPSIPPPTAGAPVTSTAVTAAPSPTSADSLADVVAALEADTPPARARTPTAQRFRPAATGGSIGRFANNSSRRPQAPAAAEPPKRRGSTEVNDYEMETEVGKEDWKSALAVEDEQLVDWSSTETQHDADDLNHRKR